MASLRALRPGGLCGVRPVSRSKEQAVAQVDAHNWIGHITGVTGRSNASALTTRV